MKLNEDFLPFKSLMSVIWNSCASFSSMTSLREFCAVWDKWHTILLTMSILFAKNSATYDSLTEENCHPPCLFNSRTLTPVSTKIWNECSLYLSTFSILISQKGARIFKGSLTYCAIVFFYNTSPRHCHQLNVIFRNSDAHLQQN